jgi:hypothetical protein
MLMYLLNLLIGDIGVRDEYFKANTAIKFVECSTVIFFLLLVFLCFIFALYLAGRLDERFCGNHNKQTNNARLKLTIPVVKNITPVTNILPNGKVSLIDFNTAKLQAIEAPRTEFLAANNSVVYENVLIEQMNERQTEHLCSILSGVCRMCRSNNSLLVAAKHYVPDLRDAMLCPLDGLYGREFLAIVEAPEKYRYSLFNLDLLAIKD